MRLVALAPDAEGRVRGALQIEPAPGWITYWREPGEGGIPPQLTLAADSNLTLEKIAYPAPKPISVGTTREIGYDNPVALPLDLSRTNASDPVKLDLTAFIGLCKDICIPFQATFSLPLPAIRQSQPEEEAILQAAAASLPESPTAEFKVESHALSADDKSLTVKLTLPDGDGDAPQIYVTGPSGYVFSRQQAAKRNGTSFTTDIAIAKLPRSYDIHGKSWGILIIDGRRSMETTLAFN
jgi:DsbC/DsbD-like thiol-disulfide interchange protein